MHRRRVTHKQIVRPLCVTATIVALYVASYPPTLLIVEKHRLIPHGLFSVLDGEDVPFFKPVDWLIDHTPMRSIILSWSDLFGNRNYLEGGILKREAARSLDLNDATQWINVQ